MWRNRVVWSDGLFLRPQHFQQQQRHIDAQFEATLKALYAYPWGIDRLLIDEAALAMGMFQVNTVSGMLPDGTAFAVPDHDSPPVPLQVPVDAKNQVVMLALPIARAGLANVALKAPRSDSLVRYSASSADVLDENDGFGEDASVQIGLLSLRLLLERDVTGAFLGIPIARIIERRADGQVVLDQHFIASSLNVTSQRLLRGFLTELVGLLRQRTEALAARITSGGRGGVAEVADFMLLQMANRQVGGLEHLSGLPLLHPETLYAQCVTMAHELATFSVERRLPQALPVYNHSDLQACFQVVMMQLRLALSMVLEQTAIQIELHDRKYGVRVAVVADQELLKTASFVLAVNAQLPSDALRARFPTQVKIGPVEKIRDLVNLQLPGVTLRALPVAPRQIPFHTGFSYFELDTKNELWGMLARSGGLALHVSGQFPDLELELWAIRG
jgi:type VI secretion system protein ImpJ